MASFISFSVLLIVIFAGLCSANIYTSDERKAMLKIADEMGDEDKWRVTKTCWFDLELDDNPVGRIEIALFGEVAPITVSNFAALCKGNYNHDAKFGYKGSRFHRFVPDFVLQGGDITHFDGTGGKSIYGNSLADEPIVHRHTGVGYVAMAHMLKPNSASSQFYITLAKARWLDGFHVVFGKVIEGLDVLDKLNNKMVAREDQFPTKELVISDAGLTKHSPYILPENQR
jgi:cyclophilin family peptidyl-prolyl cis-trans isomerase